MVTMKICKKCGNEFPERITVDGIERILKHRKTCIDCTPFQSTHKGQTYRKANGLHCVSCGKALKGKQTKFCSSTCQMGELQSYEQQQDKGLKRKIYLVLQSGGECQKCGYDQNLAALTFHHREPEKKKFELDMRNLSNRRWTSLLKEYAKCDVLCANCHMSEHHPDYADWLHYYDPNYADDYDV